MYRLRLNASFKSKPIERPNLVRSDFDIFLFSIYFCFLVGLLVFSCRLTKMKKFHHSGGLSPSLFSLSLYFIQSKSDRCPDSHWSSLCFSWFGFYFSFSIFIRSILFSFWKSKGGGGGAGWFWSIDTEAYVCGFRTRAQQAWNPVRFGLIFPRDFFLFSLSGWLLQQLYLSLPWVWRMQEGERKNSWKASRLIHTRLGLDVNVKCQLRGGAVNGLTRAFPVV